MKRLEKLTEFIINGERSRAEILLDNIYKENECPAYCRAFEKILLTEAAQRLNDSVRGFYIDCGKLKTALFSDNPPTRKTVLDSFRDILSDAATAEDILAYEKAMDFIKRNLTDCQLSVRATAEYSGLSDGALLKLFREHSGKTTSEYINSERVTMSLAFLENGETVEQASEKCGFSSAETYIRAFKKYMGTTPGVWKRNKLFL